MGRVLPILFNADMVRAILGGRKTVTRRVVRPANPFKNKEGYSQGNGLWIDGYSRNDKPNGHIKDYNVSSCWIRKNHYIDKYAPYRPGDIMYVRETWQDLCLPTKDGSELHDYAYKASNDDGSIKWRPSIHMPKKAARIWLKVTDIRIERLQDINEDGAVKEGVFPSGCRNCTSKISCDTCSEEGYDEMDAFVEIWDSTVKKSDLAKYGWDANPWVWVIEFERCEKPESEVKK